MKVAQKSFFQNYDSSRRTLLGTNAALLQFSGAIKSLPYLNIFLIDPTLIFLLLVSLGALEELCKRRYRASRLAATFLALQAAFVMWLLLSGAWSSSTSIVYEKLIFLIIFCPLMTLFGLFVMSSSRSFDAFCNSIVLIGFACATVIPIATVRKLAVIGGHLHTEATRVQYQIVGLAIAAAVSILATRLVVGKANRPLLSLGALTLLVSGGAYIAGRAAFLAVIACLFISPLSIIRCIRWRGALQRILVSAFFIMLLIAFLLAEGSWYAKIPVVVRFLKDDFGATDSRSVLWMRAVSEASFFGVGAAGFAPVAGFGDVRKWYPHNLWLEALVEGGIPGLIMFSLLLITALVSIVKNREVLSEEHFGIVVGFSLIFFVQTMTSTDLGNRMAWLWLGLFTGTSLREASDAQTICR